MKSKQREKAPVTKPLLKQLTDQHRTNSRDPKQNPTIEVDLLEPAELDQDPGAGYNPDHTFPQT